MTVRIGLAVFLHLSVPPNGAFRDDDQRIVTRIIRLVLHQETTHAIEFERVLGNQASRGGHIGCVQRREAGIASKNSKQLRGA